jgi:hypothetical protein
MLRLPPRQEVEGNTNRLVERQETLLAILWQVRSHIYTSTGEAVHTLKCPIRGMDNDAIKGGYKLRW